MTKIGTGIVFAALLGMNGYAFAQATPAGSSATGGARTKTTTTAPPTGTPGAKPPGLQGEKKGCPPGQVGNKNSNNQGRFSNC